jgi:hypothetical protein
LSFSEPGLGLIITISISQFVVYMFILVLLELKDRVNFNRFSNRLKRKSTVAAINEEHDLDVDVENESNRVQSLDVKYLSEPVVVRNLVKKFKKNSRTFSAVKNLNFGMSKASCFG